MMWGGVGLYGRPPVEGVWLYSSLLYKTMAGCPLWAFGVPTCHRGLLIILFDTTSTHLYTLDAFIPTTPDTIAEVHVRRRINMIEPISTGIAISLLVKNASTWLPVINEAIISPARDALIGKLTEKAIDKGFEIGRKGRDEKEQVRHLELALKNAAERGLAQFQTTEEQQQYSQVISVLAATANADALRREAMRLFTLDAPD